MSIGKESGKPANSTVALAALVPYSSRRLHRDVLQQFLGVAASGD